MRFVGSRGNPAEVSGDAALHTQGRPLSVQPRSGGAVGGAYSMGIDNGATVLTAGMAGASEIFQMRWAPASSGTQLLVLKRLRISVGAVVGFAAGRMLFRLFKAKAWTVNGTAGTQVLPAANQNKRRTTGQSDSLFVGGGDIRIAATVPLGAGTKVTETVAKGSIATAAPTSIGPILTLVPLFEQSVDDDWPLFLEPNEGLVIVADVPGTGTWYLGVHPEWDEVDDYK